MQLTEEASGKVPLRAPTSEDSLQDCVQEEVQEYINKLALLVPHAPKHGHLSRLEVVEYVIDYISSLEKALQPCQSVQTGVSVDPAPSEGSDIKLNRPSAVSSGQLASSSTSSAASSIS